MVGSGLEKEPGVRMVELGGSELWLDRVVVAGPAVEGGTDSDRKKEEMSPSSGGDEEPEGVDSVVVVVVVVVVAGPRPFLPNFRPGWLGHQLPPRRLGCISL